MENPALHNPAFTAKRFALFGLGKAGQAAAKLLLAYGAEVVAWDDKEASRLAMPDGVILQPIAEMPWAHMEALVLSPGIPFTHPEPHPVVKLAQRHGVRIICDIELLYLTYPEAVYVAITGTNGKSTTTALTGHIAQKLGIDVGVGGNIGVAASALALEEERELYVLELSSYQLDLLVQTRFQVSVFLNITPDHIDRHGSMQGYINAKKHIFDRQNRENMAVIVTDDEYTRELYRDLKVGRAQQVIEISTHNPVMVGVFSEHGLVTDSLFDQETLLALHPPKSLQGPHNLQNILAAYTALRVLGEDPQRLVDALLDYPGLPHRMQYVTEKNGITFINDSKATNAVATEQALKTFNPIHWIIGGIAKEGGIEPLRAYFPRIAHAYLIGAAQEEFAKTLEGTVPYTRSGTLEQAFANAVANLQTAQGGTLLLSPACASFDQFKSFEQRGARFVELVDGYRI